MSSKLEMSIRIEILTAMLNELVADKLSNPEDLTDNLRNFFERVNVKTNSIPPDQIHAKTSDEAMIILASILMEHQEEIRKKILGKAQD